MSAETRISDERLFIRYAEGDGEAFRVLMDRWAAPLLRYCRSYLSNEDEAEDAVQEAFLRAIRSAGTYRATHTFSTWLYTIARNICLDRIKIRGRRAELRTERDTEVAEATMSEPPEAADADLEAALTPEWVERALEVLTDREMETIRLTFFAGWTSRQIADLQGCSRATVRARRFQALEKMRTRLERDGIELPAGMETTEAKEDRDPR